MELRQLRSFIAVYEEGSINRAAGRLNCAQPSLSVQLRQLEGELGVTLFERRPRGVTPTAAGARFYARATAILGDVAQARQQMRDWSGQPSGQIAVGLIPTVTKGALPQVLPAFLDEFPMVELRIAEAFSGTLADWVLDGEIEFAVGSVPPEHDGLRTRMLAREPLALIAGPACGRRHLAPVRVQDLAPISLVLPSPKHSLRQVVDREIRAGNLAVARQVEIDGLYGSLEFIRHSGWASILPVTTIVGDLDRDDLVIQPIVDPALSLEYYLVHQRQRPPSRAGELLVARLERELRRSAARWDAAVRAGAPAGAAGAATRGACRRRR